jgi:uncharacterized protein (DUF1499 family)
MKTILIILSLLILAIIVWFFILGVISKSGKAPGLVEGRLSKCSSKPNCRCSESVENKEHYIKPLQLSQNSKTDALTSIKKTITEMNGNIQTENENYLAATFTSGIFRFVDDFEIRIDTKEKVIHIRSASRVGHSDMGVNRKRIELFKQLYKKNIIR